jgi:cytochrome c peroxidase
MRMVIFSLLAAFIILLTLSGLSLRSDYTGSFPIDSLRYIYSKPNSQWPKPTVDKGINFEELAVLPPSPINLSDDSVKKIVELGKILFFDPRLSGAGKISCSSCHLPELNWTDGLKVSVGHDEAENTRNSPSIENVWFSKKLFWDGRANSLEDQAQIPLTSQIEMHQDMKVLAKKLNKIKGYRTLFADAYGVDKISNELIFNSLAVFQRTVTSAKTPFDLFLEGDKNALSDQQLEGLHLFRTKARCMNCHYGALFTDNDFHNLGLANYGKSNQDLGFYHATKNPKDSGKFKTPGLRNVMRTGPWFHDGSVKTIDSLMTLYNMGMMAPSFTMAQMEDPLFPQNDRLLRGIMLSRKEINAVISFLNAISTDPIVIKTPTLPK